MEAATWRQTNFQGTATEANYADLAEKYTTDTQYPRNNYDSWR